MGAVVVAGCRVGTTGDLVGITDAVVIAVVVYDQAVLARLADSIDVGTERVVGVGRWCAVVVAGCRVGTTGDLVGITYAVVITVVVYDQAVFACLADSIDVGTERVVCVGRWCAVVVTGCRVGTTGDLVGITNAVLIAVVVYDLAIDACLADSIDVGTERVVCVGCWVLS